VSGRIREQSSPSKIEKYKRIPRKEQKLITTLKKSDHNENSEKYQLSKKNRLIRRLKKIVSQHLMPVCRRYMKKREECGNHRSALEHW
jgi:hypothetical protein